ncbi:MAG: hypothetical protein Q7T55_10020 [Solirubrobacteraceae bacterium]|nr:hypothetical protein [Solirubrobacteraceae bacterium]
MTNPHARPGDEPDADDPLTPAEGGSQSGTQIDESEIDAPQDDQSPTTDNDVT